MMYCVFLDILSCLLKVVLLKVVNDYFLSARKKVTVRSKAFVSILHLSYSDKAYREVIKGVGGLIY